MGKSVIAIGISQGSTVDPKKKKSRLDIVFSGHQPDPKLKLQLVKMLKTKGYYHFESEAKRNRFSITLEFKKEIVKSIILSRPYPKPKQEVAVYMPRRQPVEFLMDDACNMTVKRDKEELDPSDWEDKTDAISDKEAESYLAALDEQETCVTREAFYSCMEALTESQIQKGETNNCYAML